jgi:uncharacterized membrane protein
MDSFIPFGSLKREEIYSFIGGFFIASSWYMYFTNLPCDTSTSSIDLVTNPIFLISWLLSTALLYAIQLFINYIITLIITPSLKNKSPMERKKILGLKDPVEDFIFAEYVNDVKISVHLVEIIIISALISLFPLYELSSPFVEQNTSCLILFLVVLVGIALVLAWLLFIFIKLWKMFVVIHLLKAEGSLEIIDQNTYTQERAAYIAKVANERSKQKLQNYLDQQKTQAK